MAKDSGPHQMKRPPGLPKLPPRFARKEPARPETAIKKPVKPSLGTGHFEK